MTSPAAHPPLEPRAEPLPTGEDIYVWAYQSAPGNKMSASGATTSLEDAQRYAPGTSYRANTTQVKRRLIKIHVEYADLTEIIEPDGPQPEKSPQ